MILLLHVKEVTQLSVSISEYMQEAEEAAGAIQAPVVPGTRGVVSLFVRSAQQVNMKAGHTCALTHTVPGAVQSDSIHSVCETSR